MYGPGTHCAVPECTGTYNTFAPLWARRGRPKNTASPVSCAVRSRTARGTSNRYSRAVAVVPLRSNHMLLIVGVVIVLIAVVISPKMRVPGGVNASTLGWMSDKWLAEHRASHSR